MRTVNLIKLESVYHIKTVIKPSLNDAVSRRLPVAVGPVDIAASLTLLP